MQGLLDLDKLHKLQRRQKVKHIIIGSSLVLVVPVTGIIVLGSKKSDNHLAAFLGIGATAPNISSVNTAPVTSSASAANLSQAAAEDESLAKEEVADAQNSQTALDSETLPSDSTTLTTIPVPAPATPLPASTCTVSSNLANSYNAYIQAEGALTNFEQGIQQPGALGEMYPGTDAAQKQLSSLEGTVNQAQSAYEAAESSDSC